MANVWTNDTMFARLRNRYQTGSRPPGMHLADLLDLYWRDPAEGGVVPPAAANPRGQGQWAHMNKAVPGGSKHYGDKANTFWQQEP